MHHKRVPALLCIILYAALCVAFAVGQAADARAAEAVAADDDLVDYSTQSSYADRYDYIVVGVGHAGSITASRLAVAGNTVLGIENGGPTHRSLGGKDYVASDYSFDSDGNVVVNEPWTRFDVPNFFSTIYDPPSPYPNLRFIKNGVDTDSTVAGKLLGGSGVHNGMIWLRFTKETINSWNVTGWSYNDLLRVYKRLENATGSAAADPTYHGLSGPIGISDTPNNAFYSAAPIWITTCNNTGLPLNRDFNGASRIGCGQQRFNIRRGVRDSCAHTHLPKALKTGRLSLSLFSTATKILLKRDNGKIIAYGVQFVKNGVTKRAFANKEIIISASAIITPKLLMLSGIGPAADLARHGIKQVVNSPNVGKGLSCNHVGFGSWEYPNAPLPNGLKASAFNVEYAINGTGPFSHTGAFAYSYGCTNTSKPCVNPDYMCGIQTGGFATAGSVATTVSAQFATHDPKVRGTLTLSSSDPFAPPSVTVDEYGNADDLKAVIASIRRHRQIFNTAPANTIFGKELRPGPQYATDAQLGAWIRQNVPLGYHWVSTARMGNSGDTRAVVDPKLRVLGVSRLRVGDASVLPSTNSHSQATAALVGERVADFILGTN